MSFNESIVPQVGMPPSNGSPSSKATADKAGGAVGATAQRPTRSQSRIHRFTLQCQHAEDRFMHPA